MADPTTNTLNKGQMETKKAKEYLFHTWIKEDYTIKTENGNITALELLEHFEGYLKEEFKKQTTSQHQTIERLREELKESNIILNSLRLSMSVHPDNKPDSEFRGLVSLSYNQIIKVQQLLNTTEPNKTV